MFAPDDHAGDVAAVSMNGAPSGTVDYFTAGGVSNGLRWTSPVLANGDHVVTFGSANQASNHVESFDHADVYV